MAARIVDNGPFDSRIRNIPGLVSAPGWNGSNLTKGYVISEKPINGVRYRCNFLYNPSTISLTHGINPNVISNQDAINPLDASSGQPSLLPLQQTLSFNLLFDRTYELWDYSQLPGDLAQNIPTWGVAWDVFSLYKITGIASPIDISSAQGGGNLTDSTSIKKGTFENGAVGPMLYIPVFAVIGSSLDYYGVITEMDVQYTHWTQYMVPSRCTVAVTMTLLPRNATKANPRPVGPDGNGIPGLPSGIDPSNGPLAPQNNGKGGR